MERLHLLTSGEYISKRIEEKADEAEGLVKKVVNTATYYSAIQSLSNNNHFSNYWKKKKYSSR